MPTLNGLFRGAVAAALWTLWLCGQSWAQGDWQLKFNADGVQVHERAFPNARVPELRAVSVFDVAPEVMWNVIRDYARYPETMPYIKESRILKTEGERVVYVYALVDVDFFGVWTRDYVVKFVEESELNGERRYRTAWTLANELAPPKPASVVRIELNQGSWEVVALDEGARTLVVYQGVVDPGGALPSATVRWANSSALPKLFEALRKAVQDPRYQVSRCNRSALC
jgi:Polyketide cyclase / dehydrase and lipid transport